MNRKLMELAEKYVAQRKRRMRLLKTVTALALVVAICTSYVLMMPGLTMAAETYCGLEEHTHTADCYVDELTCLISEREAETVFTDIMRCSFEPHRHSSDCYNAQGELSCGYWATSTSMTRSATTATAFLSARWRSIRCTSTRMPATTGRSS
jgi:hypothetical protein